MEGLEPWGGLLRTDVNGGPISLSHVPSVSGRAGVSRETRGGGETHTSSIKNSVNAQIFSAPPKQWKEVQRTCLAGAGKPLVLTPVAMEDHRTKRNP